MDKQSVFKTSFYGFDKEAVLKYIDEVSEAATRSEDVLQSKVDELAHSREQLEIQIQGFSERVTNIEGELNLEKGKNKKLSGMIDNLQIEIDRQRRQSEAKEHEYQVQQDQNRLLKARADSLELKSQKYDEASQTIGIALLEAQQNAKQIIDTAGKKAITISKDADVVISGILSKIDGMKTDFISLRGKMNESIEMLNRKFDEIETDIENSKVMVQKASGGDEMLEAVLDTQWNEVPDEDYTLGKSQVQEQEMESSQGKLNLTEQELQKHRYF